MKFKSLIHLQRLSLALLVFFSINAFAFKSNLTTQVNGQDATDARIEEGSKLFKTNCASCHALKGKVVGPALSGVSKKYDGDYKWLVSWIRNNQALIKSGDKRAVAIYEEYNGQAMNIFESLSEDQVTSILMWIENDGDGDAPVAAPTAEGAAAAPVSDGTFNKINWLTVVLAILIFAIIILILGILDVVSNITGKQVVNWNNFNAFMFLLFGILFFAYVIYEYKVHGALLLPESASIHGIAIDRMMKITIILTTFVFFVTHALLFYFAFKYREKPGQKAFYYPHNNKLEYIWTTIPAVVLTVLVLGGLKTWKQITKSTVEDPADQIEVFAYQFGWSARYPGADGRLGNADYNLISGSNPLGVANLEFAKSHVDDLKQEIVDLEKALSELPKKRAELQATLGGLVGTDRKDHLRKIEKLNPNGEAQKDLELTLRARHTQIRRIEQSIAAAKESGFYNDKGNDDLVVQELHIVKDKPVTLKFRGRDVIHSAYLPYFRTQMNVVPGLPTQFTFTPIISTNEMRAKKGDPEFDYYIVCNKICGNAHFNMKLKVVVESQSEYDKWIKQNTGIFVKKTEDASESTEIETTTNTEAVAIN